MCSSDLRQADDLHPIRNIVRHLQRALADRSRRAQNDHAFSFHPKEIRFSRPDLVQPNDETEIKKQKRRGEEQAVDQIKRAADSRKQITRIFHAGAAFDD